MNPTKKAYLQLHIAIFLWGFTAILGDLISLVAFWLVWWRVGFTSLSLVFFPNVLKKAKNIPLADLRRFGIVGVLIAIHWITFFGSIKYANASVALVAMSTSALFTSFIEPIFNNKRLKKLDIIFGLAVIPGMSLVVNDLKGDMLLGLFVGLLSAFLAALFAVINKKYISVAEPIVMTFIELSSSWLFLSLLIPIVIVYTPDSIQWLPASADWVYLLILSLLCTTLAFMIHLYALRHISAFASNLVINLEPVYGILLAGIFLSDFEELNPTFYIGVVLILVVIFLYPLISKRVGYKSN